VAGQYRRQATPNILVSVRSSQFPRSNKQTTDVLWEKPGLERLYARLEDEYELKERVDGLDRKLTLIAETANALTDIIDTRRSLRLEVAIVLLIVFEIAIAVYQITASR
jgi:uncharacterized Rmd1/YagE family protein